MKIVARPVDMIAVFYQKGQPVPYKFRYETREGIRKKIQVDLVLETEKRNLAGIPVILYRCQSQYEGQEIRYELKYLIKEVRWELYKI